MSRRVSKFMSYPGEGTPYGGQDFAEPVKEFCDAEYNAVVGASSTSTNAAEIVSASRYNRLRVAKCIVVGDISVGKTSLIQRFGYNVYANDYKATIGVDFDVQKFDILRRPFSLQIWDTAGEDRFRVITRNYYRGAHVALIVFDLSNMSSFLNVRSWLKEISVEEQSFELSQRRQPDAQHDRPLIFLVGSKKDLLTYERLEFFETEARKLATEIGGEFWMISSQTGDSVVDLFTRVACLTFQGMIEDEIRLANEQELFSRSLQQANNNNNNNNNRNSSAAETKYRKKDKQSPKLQTPNGQGIHFINRNSGMVCLPRFFNNKTSDKDSETTTTTTSSSSSPGKYRSCRQALVRQREHMCRLCHRMRLGLANLCSKMSLSSNSATVAPSDDRKRKQSILDSENETMPRKARTFQFFRLKCIVGVD